MLGECWVKCRYRLNIAPTPHNIAPTSGPLLITVLIDWLGHPVEIKINILSYLTWPKNVWWMLNQIKVKYRHRLNITPPTPHSIVPTWVPQNVCGYWIKCRHCLNITPPRPHNIVPTWVPQNVCGYWIKCRHCLNITPPRPHNIIPTWPQNVWWMLDQMKGLFKHHSSNTTHRPNMALSGWWMLDKTQTPGTGRASAECARCLICVRQYSVG